MCQFYHLINVNLLNGITCFSIFVVFLIESGQIHAREGLYLSHLYLLHISRTNLFHMVLDHNLQRHHQSVRDRSHMTSAKYWHF